MSPNPTLRPIHRLFLATCLTALVSACSGGPWFGESEVPLPGARISVLQHQQDLTPDPELASAEILLPRPTPNTNWSQAGGTANHAMHHIAVGDDLKRAWSRDIGTGASDDERFVASPIVANGRIYAMDVETVVSAFDEQTGDLLWETELTPDNEEDGHIGGGLAYEDGRLFVATGFGEAIALNAETGEVHWRHAMGGPMRAAPTVRGGRAFFITVDNKLTALGAINGDELWAFQSIEETAAILGGASPAVDSGVVVAPFSSGELVAIRVENGRVLWTDSLASVRRSDEVSTLAHIRGRPVIDRGRVFAISHGGVLVAIDLRSGRRIWEQEVGGLQSPWIAGDYLFVLSGDSRLIALSRDSGRIFWITELPRFEDPEDKTDPIIWTGPLLTSDRLVVAGSQGEAMAISPYTGKILGRVEMPDGVSVPPIAAGGAIFFLSDNADLVAYR
ncbi:MAG: PQQ-binding-like beta-propeller repeat protein [Rhodospirillales bacterium]